MRKMSAATETAALLNEACRRVVDIVRAGDKAAMAGLAERLAERAASAGGPDDPRHFLGALAGLLRGRTAAELAPDLPAAWRPALEAVASDMAGAGRAQGAEHRAWVADLAAQTAAVLKARDRAGAMALDAALNRLVEPAGRLDEDAARFVWVLRGALGGRDVRTGVLALVEPYAQAYRSLEAIVRGADPRSALIARVVHNTRLVLERNDEATSADYLQAMVEVEAQARAIRDEELVAFIAAARSLVDGTGAEERASFGAGDLDAAWAAMRGPSD